MRNERTICQYCTRQIADNYFIIKCLLKSNMARVFLFTHLLRRAYLIQCNTNLVKQVEANYSIALHCLTLIRILCTLFICLESMAFVIELFSNVLCSYKCVISPNIWLLLKTGTYGVFDFTMSTFFPSNLDYVRLCQSFIL